MSSSKNKRTKKIEQKRIGVGITEPQRKKLVELLTTAYNMEMETVLNYRANSIFLDGILAKEIKNSLDKDVTDELGHATLLAKRLKVHGGRIPGSMELKMTQKTLQPPKETIDVEYVIQGVIDAEEGAIAHYQTIIDYADEIDDDVTEDLAVQLKGDEEEHRREFVGYQCELAALKKMFGK